jgi:hypothetical protein
MVKWDINPLRRKNKTKDILKQVKIYRVMEKRD